MVIDSFSKQKNNALSKIDKSSIGHWDEKIISLCEKINENENYYTTSSCSGRIVVIKDKGKERGDLFVKVWHDLIKSDELMRELDKILDSQVRLEDKQGLIENLGDNNFLAEESSEADIIKFKQEPPILHVACRRLEDALELLIDARGVGYKRSGIISKGERFIVEILSTEKLEFPIIKEGKLLVSGEFLKIIVEKSNENLNKGWEKIERLRKLL